MEKKLTKRQQKAMDPNAIVENIPTIPSTFEEFKKRIAEGLKMREELTPEGATAASRRPGVASRYIDPLDRNALFLANPEGFSSQQIRELQNVEKEMQKKAKMEALKKMIETNPPPEPLVDPKLDTSVERAYAEALKKDPRLAEPENRNRFMDLISKKMRQ